MIGRTSILRLVLPAFLCLLSLSCFDYEERIVLAPNFSGYVDIEYTVPIYNSEDRSLVEFLPADQAKVERKYERLINEKRVSIDNFTRTIQPATGQEEAFQRTATVKYRIQFLNAQDLETILIGKTTVVQRGGRLQILRSFPVGASLPVNSGRISRRLHELTLKTLHRRSMKFTILYPWYYDLLTNHGSIVKPGFEFFQLPLETTMQGGGPGSIVWSIDFKANLEPRASP